MQYIHTYQYIFYCYLQFSELRDVDDVSVFLVQVRMVYRMEFQTALVLFIH